MLRPVAPPKQTRQPQELTPELATWLLYVDRIGPLRPDEDVFHPPELGLMLQAVETPVGLLYTLNPSGRRHLGYKNPWKPVGARFLARRYTTRRLVEALRLERPVTFKARFRGSLLLWDADRQGLLLVAGYYSAPSKPTLMDLFRKAEALNARALVAFDRPRGGRPFNLLRSGAIEYRPLRDLPERPGANLVLVRARP